MKDGGVQLLSARFFFKHPLCAAQRQIEKEAQTKGQRMQEYQ